MFPSAAMIRAWGGVLHTLVSFENDSKKGSGNLFNFILTNGTRSTQRDDKAPTKYEYMIPVNALNKIRRVAIYYEECIYGFSFFDKDGALLWEVGWAYGGFKEETVVLAENEVIVGVVAKLRPR